MGLFHWFHHKLNKNMQSSASAQDKPNMPATDVKDSAESQPTQQGIKTPISKKDRLKFKRDSDGNFSVTVPSSRAFDTYKNQIKNGTYNQRKAEKRHKKLFARHFVYEPVEDDMGIVKQAQANLIQHKYHVYNHSNKITGKYTKASQKPLVNEEHANSKASEESSLSPEGAKQKAKLIREAHILRDRPKSQSSETFVMPSKNTVSSSKVDQSNPQSSNNVSLASSDGTKSDNSTISSAKSVTYTNKPGSSASKSLSSGNSNSASSSKSFQDQNSYAESLTNSYRASLSSSITSSVKSYTQSKKASINASISSSVSSRTSSLLHSQLVSASKPSSKAPTDTDASNSNSGLSVSSSAKSSNNNEKLSQSSNTKIMGSKKNNHINSNSDDWITRKAHQLSCERSKAEKKSIEISNEQRALSSASARRTSANDTNNGKNILPKLVADSTRQLASMQSLNNSMSASYNKASKSNAKLISSYATKSKSMHEESKSLHDEIDTYDKSISTLRKQIDSANHQVSKSKSASEKVRRKLNRKLKDIKHRDVIRLNAADNSIKLLKRDLHQNRNNKKDARRYKEMLRQARNHAKQIKSQLNNSNHQLNKRLNTYKQKNQQLVVANKSSNDIMADMASLNVKYRKEHKQRLILKHRLHQVLIPYKNTKKFIKQLQISRLKIKSMKSGMHKYYIDNVKGQRKNANLRKTIESLSKSSRHNTVKQNHQLQTLKNMVNARDNSIQDLKDEIKSYHDLDVTQQNKYQANVYQPSSSTAQAQTGSKSQWQGPKLEDTFKPTHHDFTPHAQQETKDYHKSTAKHSMSRVKHNHSDGPFNGLFHSHVHEKPSDYYKSTEVHKNQRIFLLTRIVHNVGGKEQIYKTGDKLYTLGLIPGPTGEEYKTHFVLNNGDDIPARKRQIKLI